MPIAHTFAGASLRRFGFQKTAIAAEVDAYFKNTVLLLPGDGTNGAQNNTFLDSSTNAFSITRNGNTTQGTFSPFSQTGWSNYFDGNGDYLDAGSNSAFSFGTGAYTVEMWVYPNSISQQVYLFNDTTNGFGFYFETTGSAGFTIAPRSGAGAVLTGGYSALNANQWNHIVAVRSSTSSNATSIFVNGTRVANGTDSTNWSVTGPLLLGGLQANIYQFAGYISNARVVKGTAVYDPSQTTLTVPTSPLTAITNTSLLTCQSNRFVDNSTNAFAITVNGNPSVQAFSPFAPTAAYSAATNGGSGYFDGTGDYLGLQDSNAAYDLGSSSTPFTVECWFYSTQDLSPSTSYNLLQRGGGTDSWSTSSGIQFALYTYAGQIEWDFNTSGSPTTVVSTAGVKQGSWYHVAVSYNGTTTALFLNGSRQATSTAAYTLPTTRNIARIGTKTAATTPAWAGYISGMRIINGTAQYDPTSTTITIPTAPPTAVTNTSFLANFTNAGITDATAKNDLETVGNAQISNGAAKFGSTSMYFDGTGDALKIPSSPNFAFGTGNFTVEFWMYATDTNFGILYEGRSSGSPNNPSIQWSPTSYTSKIVARMNDTAAIQSGTLSTNTWYHVALVRSGTTATLYIDGTSAGTYTYSTSVTQVPIFIGDYFDGGYDFSGYLDDLRITKGIARYTANFTAPTKAFALQ